MARILLSEEKNLAELFAFGSDRHLLRCIARLNKDTCWVEGNFFVVRSCNRSKWGLTISIKD